MKRLSLLIALLIINQMLAVENNNSCNDVNESPYNEVNSNISQVTVYLSGAQVSRKALVNTDVGTTTFVFKELSPHIDENSIQISGLGEAAILSINYGLDYLSTPKFPEKVAFLKKRLDTLKRQQLRLSSSIDGLTKEEDVLNTNKRLGSETVEIDIEKVKAMATYYRNRLTEIRNELIDIREEKKDVIEEIQKIEQQFKEFNVTEETQKGIITVKLNSAVATALNIKLTYTVSEAGWFPMYDLRAVTVNEPLDLLYKSHVYQKTGVNWDDVNLILSTGDPNTDTNKPQVETKFLNFVNRYSYTPRKATKAYNYKYNPNVRKVTGIVYDETGFPLPGANVVIKGTTTGTQTDFDGKYALDIAYGSELVFSYVGYETEEIPVHASQINVNLDANNELDEIIVTAQGMRREKKALEYSVSEILNGRVSGVSMPSSSRNTRANKNIIIRGYSSIQATKKSLFIIDGIPYESGDVSSNGYFNLEPDQIANINILKGTAATALYGSDGRNGVVVVTTKKGTATGQVKYDALTTTRFEIQTPYSIPSDGDVTVIEVDKFDVPAMYEYFAAPVLNENVFLTAKIKDWEQFSLLPGEANIYFEGSFAGKTYINPLATTEELTISLGIDPGVVVQRKQEDNFKDKSFIGSTMIVSNAYTITLKNSKNKPIEVTLLDRIPISQNKEIKIVDIETIDAEYDDKTGIAKWKLKLQPQETKKQSISYSVRYPRLKSINL